jgi:hypothetical protein
MQSLPACQPEINRDRERGEKMLDRLLIFLKTESSQSPNNILETKSISESIIYVQREKLFIGPDVEDLF